MEMQRHFVLVITCTLCLSACSLGSKQTTNAPDTQVSGGKASVYALMHLDKATQSETKRPGGILSVYTSLFLSQNGFLPTQSAQTAIAAQSAITAGQTGIETSETFSLLKELGAALQVDIPDMLNRSSNRDETLDTYVRSLTNLQTLAERKATELKALEDQAKDERATKKKEVRDLDNAISRALRDGDYEFAGSNQEQLAKEQGELADIETKLDQAGAVLDAYEKLLKVAKERLTAITLNRRVLIAGLKVVDVPGVKDLDVLQKSSLFNRNGGETINQSFDPFGVLGD